MKSFGSALVDRQQLAILRDRPQVVWDQRLKFVDHLAQLAHGRDQVRRGLARADDLVVVYCGVRDAVAQVVDVCLKVGDELGYLRQVDDLDVQVQALACRACGVQGVGCLMLGAQARGQEQGCCHVDGDTRLDT